MSSQRCSLLISRANSRVTSYTLVEDPYPIDVFSISAVTCLFHEIALSRILAEILNEVSLLSYPKAFFFSRLDQYIHKE